MAAMEEDDGPFQRIGILLWLHPDVGEVVGGDTRGFHPHECNVHGKWQVPEDEVGEVLKARKVLPDNDDADFHVALMADKMVDAGDSFGKGAFDGRDGVVLDVVVSVKRDAKQRPGRAVPHNLDGHFKVGETPAVGQKLHFRIRKPPFR